MQKKPLVDENETEGELHKRGGGPEEENNSFVHKLKKWRFNTLFSLLFASQ
jgi:hypothetical protein